MMQITCYRCGRIHRLGRLAGDFVCPCGEKTNLEELRLFQQISGEIEDKERFDEIQKMADDISARIVSGEFSPVDLDIAKEKLRSVCEEHFPEKMYLFEMLYESRFRRLWQQFRQDLEEGNLEGGDAPE
ncbi:MAG: hypothetical protein HY714_02900 [Candidatus Omnitrophica bacterium]|nr:hypothetical protein [Candidatus Omnitrophota bacterium]